MLSNRLFAFQIAEPLGLSDDEAPDVSYDPQTQISVWQGGNCPPNAVFCCSLDEDIWLEIQLSCGDPGRY